jgi:hypothetical protein
MTIPVINFPGPDSNNAPKTLRAALTNSVRLLGSFPKTGLLLKVKNDSQGEQVSHWGLVDPGKIVPLPLQDALASESDVTFGSFPSTGIILKIREDGAGERLVNWVLADPAQIEMLAIGLSVSSPDDQ